MERKAIFRISMLVVGILAASVILLSQSFYKSDSSGISYKMEQTAEEQGQSFVSAPSDLLAGTDSVQVVEEKPIQLTELPKSKPSEKFFHSTKKVVSSFFKTLFRAIISSNAP